MTMYTAKVRIAPSRATDYIRGVSGRETRRKPLAFAADWIKGDENYKHYGAQAEGPQRTASCPYAAPRSSSEAWVVYEIPWSHKSDWFISVTPVFGDGNCVKPRGFAVDGICERVSRIINGLVRAHDYKRT